MNEERRVRTFPHEFEIIFNTHQPQFDVPCFPFVVHSRISREDLNILINSLLKKIRNYTDDLTFDFLINDHFIRTDFHDFVLEHRLVYEGCINVEYFERFLPPQPKDFLLHDDWVSAVAVLNDWILVGCYDNAVHIWSTNGERKQKIRGHTASVKSVAWISLDENLAKFVSASLDHTAILWEWNITENVVRCLNVCKGHDRSVETVGVNYDKTLIATGSADTTLNIWTTTPTSEESEDGQSTSKRLKSDFKIVKEPCRTFRLHSEAVSGAIWTNANELITSSWDRTINIVDCDQGQINRQIVASNSIFDIDYSSPLRAILTASADNDVKIYDPRLPGDGLRVACSSHSRWTQCVCWSSYSEYMFISGAYDNLVKVWDIRSPNASLHDIDGHQDKILCCNWSNKNFIITGGVDNTLRVYNAIISNYKHQNFHK